jgi:hypothetical protein
MCSNNNSCPLDCMDITLKTVQIAKPVTGRWYYVRVESWDPGTSATITFTQGVGLFNLLGRWFFGGNASQPASVQQRNGRLSVTNERGDTAAAHMDGNTIVADGWGGLRGTVADNGRTINWANGTSWMRAGSKSGGTPGDLGLLDFLGGWYFEGDRSKPASVQQRDGNLSVTNERGDTAAAHMDGNTIVADGWGGLRGTLADNGRTINWANGTSWKK